MNFDSFISQNTAGYLIPSTLNGYQYSTFDIQVSLFI